MLGFLLMTSFAYADPQFVKLEEGESAPFTGRLFNDEAVTKLVVEDKFKVEQCDLQIDYEKKKLEALHNLDYLIFWPILYKYYSFQFFYIY